MRFYQTKTHEIVDMAQISKSFGKYTTLLITYLDFSDCTIIVGYVHSM